MELSKSEIIENAWLYVSYGNLQGYKEHNHNILVVWKSTELFFYSKMNVLGAVFERCFK